MITFRPARASVSAVTPPPAPLPMMTTSASRVRLSCSAAPSMMCQPLARPASMGSAMTALTGVTGALVLMRLAQFLDGAGVADGVPGRRIGVPGADDQIVQRGVGHLQHGEAVQPPALQEGADLLHARLRPAIGHAGEEAPRRRQGEQAKQILHLLLRGQRQAEYRLVH